MAFPPFLSHPRHALAFSDTALSLMRLEGDSWVVLERVPLDAADVGARAAALLARAGTQTVALWMPPGHVVSVRVPGHGDVDAAAAVAARTGLAPESLAIATWTQRSTGDRLIFAADRETVGEALAYARGWGFNPVAVTIHPDSAPEGCRIAFPHPDLPRPGYGRPVVAAAAVLLALGIGGAWMMQTPPEPPLPRSEIVLATPPAVQEPPPAQTPIDNPGPAAATFLAAPATLPAPAEPAPLAAIPQRTPVSTAPPPAPPERPAPRALPRIDLPALAPLAALRGLPPPAPARTTPAPRLAALPPETAPPETPLPPSAAARGFAPGTPPAPPASGTPPAIVPAVPDVLPDSGAATATAPPDGGENPAAGPLPPAVAALGTLLPPPRPHEATEAASPEPPPPSAGTDAGATVPPDLAAARPVPRPPGLTPYPRVAPVAAASGAVDGPVLKAPRPAIRPRSLLVRKEIAATRPGQGASAAGAGRRQVTATQQDVAQAATVRGALRPGETGLLGVFGQGSDRQALLRLPDGQIRRVSKGDRIEGWTVSVIDDGSVRLSGSGGSRTLRVPVP